MCSQKQHKFSTEKKKKRTHEGLVGTATTGNDTDHTTGARVDDLLGTRGQLDTGLALVGVVADNGDVATRGAAQSATVANLLLDVGNDGTLGHLTDRQDVADGQSSLLAGVDELAGVHAFVGDESLGDLLELVGVAEDDLGEGSTTTCKNNLRQPLFHSHFQTKIHRCIFRFSSSLTSVVDDIADYTADVAMAFGIIESAELGGSLVQARVGRYSCMLVLWPHFVVVESFDVGFRWSGN